MTGPLPLPVRHPSRRFSRRTAIAAGVAAAVAAPMAMAAKLGPMQSSTPVAGAAAAFPPATELALTRIVARHLAQEAIPGALVGVWYPGRGTWVRGMGVADLTTAAAITPDDRVRIASITKTFTGTVVLQLVDEGKLSLDDRLASFAGGIANGEQISVRQLLNMSAGVFDYVLDPVLAGYFALPTLPLSRDQVLAIIRQHPAAFPPGSRTDYSNSDTFLLGLIIEHVTGQSAGDAITARIIDRLGLRGTSFPTTMAMPAPYAHGYDAPAPGDPLRDVTASNPDVPWTAGALISTLDDLHTWAGALANGTLLSPALQRERMVTAPMPEFGLVGLEVRYGLGLLTINGLIGHSGGIPGYSAWMLHAPDEAATLVIVTTRLGTAGPLLRELLPVVFPERFPAAPATPGAATPVSTEPAVD